MSLAGESMPSFSDAKLREVSSRVITPRRRKRADQQGGRARVCSEVEHSMLICLKHANERS